jgi:hypothetical protein
MRFYLTRLSAISLTLLVGVSAVWLWLAASRTPIAESLYERPETPPAQESNRTLGWDLTYKSVLERNYVPRREWIWKWLDSSPTPARKWVAEWRCEPIVSSILFEIPNPHAGQRSILWFVRTKDRAYYSEYVEKCVECSQDAVEKQWGVSKKVDVKPLAYDEMFAEVSSWQQTELPAVKEITNEHSFGYAGFLNIYEAGRSRQMLLSWEDIFGRKDLEDCDTSECTKRKRGILFRALFPVLIKQGEPSERQR